VDFIHYLRTITLIITLFLFSKDLMIGFSLLTVIGLVNNFLQYSILLMFISFIIIHYLLFHYYWFTYYYISHPFYIFSCSILGLPIFRPVPTSKLVQTQREIQCLNLTKLRLPRRLCPCVRSILLVNPKNTNEGR